MQEVAKVVKTSASIDIDRPPTLVYSFIVDDFLVNYPRWSPEVKRLEALSAGPMRLGWRARQVRVDQGRRTQTDFEVVDISPPSRVAFRGIKDPYFIDFSLDSTADAGTTLIFSFELGKLGFAFKPFEKLIRYAVQEGVTRVTRNIKGLIESEVPHEPR
nr:SRPBCC family protein [Spiribacter salilacus]